jgi:aryl-alcohol dehydrogenase-like predicted oxidoreductase
MPTRALGGTGEKVSLLALGGHPLGQLQDDERAVRIIRRALELGITYFDTAPSYSRHRSERRIGEALGDRRDDVLIATKSYQLPAAKALAELEGSLGALGTDRVDVFQVHAVGDAEDRARKLDPEKGVLAAALKAKRQGKVRYIGVTGHADPEVMADCLDVHDFDTLLVPVNCADPLHRSFVEHTLPRAKEKGVAVVAMKVFAAGKLVAGEKPRATVEECLRYALSQDVATATAGFDSIAELEADVRAAKAFRPLPAEAQTALTERQAPHPGRSLEWYKRED